MRSKRKVLTNWNVNKLELYLESGTTRIRTGDTRIFSPMLYQLSYGTIVFCFASAKVGLFFFYSKLLWDFFIIAGIFIGFLCFYEGFVGVKCKKRIRFVAKSYTFFFCGYCSYANDCLNLSMKSFASSIVRQSGGRRRMTFVPEQPVKQCCSLMRRVRGSL